MSEKFTASNGVEVERAAGGGDLCIFGARRDFICHEHEVALREFFLHERDTALGRWRWPDFPFYVVKEAMGNAVIYNEKSGDFSIWSRFDVESGRDGYGRGAARAYFLAHPEPKPWHDAVPGEAWVLTYEGREYAAVVDDDYDVLLGGMHRHILTSDGITAGRRIWPEVSDA